MTVPVVPQQGPQQDIIEEMREYSGSPETPQRKVGCERPDGTLNIHGEAETCAVCHPPAETPQEDAAPPTIQSGAPLTCACGGRLVWDASKGFVYCDRCTPVMHVNLPAQPPSLLAVPDGIKALVEKWRAESGSWEPGIGGGLEMCAAELEAALDPLAAAAPERKDE